MGRLRLKCMSDRMLSSNNTNGYLRFGMLGAMLIINPAVTEQQTKGNTPRESWQARNSQRVSPPVDF